MTPRTYRILKRIEALAACLAAFGYIGFLTAWHRPSMPEITQPQREQRDTAPHRTAAILPTPTKLPAKYDSHPE